MASVGGADRDRLRSRPARAIEVGPVGRHTTTVNLRPHWKVNTSPGRGYPGGNPNIRGNSRRWIVRAVENSPRRLGTDWIDLYQVHRGAALRDGGAALEPA